MPYECRVEKDSVSPEGIRLTTFVVTFPRFILAEVNTHRMLSRNSASSRAIPVEKRIAAIEADPFIPESFGVNRKGMQAVESLQGDDAENAAIVWRKAVQDAVASAKALAALGVHKQLANRLLEPFAWHTAVITATDWRNFFALRCHPDAQPEFRIIAELMRGAMAASTPTPIGYGEWHLPFITADDLAECAARDASRKMPRLVSAGRCARVSYLTHDGRRDIDADVELAQRLIAATPKHASPFEHIATPATPSHKPAGNFRGWHQFRHSFQDESVRG